MLPCCVVFWSACIPLTLTFQIWRAWNRSVNLCLEIKAFFNKWLLIFSLECRGQSSGMPRFYKTQLSTCQIHVLSDFWVFFCFRKISLSTERWWMKYQFISSYVHWDRTRAVLPSVNLTGVQVGKLINKYNKAWTETDVGALTSTT